ncbi:response regulator [Primorskyibacter sp. S187A]|uniref:response regulator n=1 Tax=Primorskyibacter sp. S187A TaxID=3415130 RepID=UPI003C7E0C16
MDSLDDLDLTPTPSASRPLLGLTVLVVEDSRFACEAMRLLCLRSGARIRRADCLKSARRHLQVYRPSVAIIDLGLPDGSGADLIAEMAEASPRISVILGISGDDAGEAAAMDAGADGFLPKPVSSVSLFQKTIMSLLPQERQLAGPRPADLDRIDPDPMAYQDDMALAADMLGGDTDERTLDYLAQFLAGVARSADDTALYDAARTLSGLRENGKPAYSQAAHIAGLVQARLSRPIAI